MNAKWQTANTPVCHFRLSKKPQGERERVEALSRFNRPRRRVRRGRGDFCAGKSHFQEQKIASLQFPRPEIRRILAETGGGAHDGRRLWRKQAVVSPMSKGGPLVRFAHDAERPLRIEDGSGGGARSARPVGEAARSKPNEQGSTASRQAQQDDHCELWGACSPVHQLVKNSFLTSCAGCRMGSPRVG